MRASREMDNGFDAAQDFVPVDSGEIAEGDVGRALRVLGGECAHGRDVRGAGFSKMSAERATDEAAGAGHQDLATPGLRYTHFQPCLR